MAPHLRVFLVWSSRGAAHGEIDNDGPLGLVVVNLNQAPDLLVNARVHSGST